MKTQEILIIGSGPGGATVAKEMSKKGHAVTIIEWGKDNPPYGGPLSSPFRFFGGMKNKSNAFLKTDNQPHIEIVRAITTGGATLTYGGVSWDPPFELFEKYGIDLKEEVNSIKQEITVKTLDDSQMGPAAKVIKRSATKMGLKWEKIDRFFQAPEKFKQTSYLFGDKTGARWDARMWVKEAIKDGAVLHNETFCEKLIIENNKVLGIVAIDDKGQSKEFRADVVIVAAGGIGSPVILNKSGIESGKGIFIDPYLVATGYLDDKLMNGEVTRQAGVLLKKDGISLGDAALPAQAYEKLIFANKKFDKISKWKQSASIVVEIEDGPSGEINSTGKIKKSLSEDDSKKLTKGREIARKILENAGAKDIWFSQIAGVHPGGGCKIGSVVNSDLSTRIQNLYVCDASVLPESMAIPPVMSILALGKRLAKHIDN